MIGKHTKDCATFFETTDLVGLSYTHVCLFSIDINTLILWSCDYSISAFVESIIFIRISHWIPSLVEQTNNNLCALSKYTSTSMSLTEKEWSTSHLLSKIPLPILIWHLHKNFQHNLLVAPTRMQTRFAHWMHLRNLTIVVYWGEGA